MGSGAKSYIWKGFLIYEEIHNFIPYMRRPLVIYDFAPDPSEFPYIWEKFYFLFYQGEEGQNANFLLLYIQKQNAVQHRKLSAMQKQLDPVEFDFAVLFSMHV